MLKKNFPCWNYSAVQELEKISSILPIIPEDRAKVFFKKACKITREKAKIVKRQSEKLFESMMGFIGASDQKDFSAFFDNDNIETFGYGVMMVETYDKIIGVTFCIVKISENTFLTNGWIGEENRNSLKKLISETFRLESKKWWEIWK